MTKVKKPTWDELYCSQADYIRHFEEVFYYMAKHFGWIWCGKEISLDTIEETIQDLYNSDCAETGRIILEYDKETKRIELAIRI